MKPIIIIGCGGNCVDILEILLELNETGTAVQYKCLGFLDDNEKLQGTTVAGLPVLGPLAAAQKFPSASFIFGVASPFNYWRRREILERLNIPPQSFITLIHPSASVSRSSSIGFGSVIFPHVTVASNARIGDHVLVLPNSIISHDSCLGDYTCVAGGVCVSGGVKVGDLCYLGTNSTIIGNISIGDMSLVGMGGAVIRDIPKNSVYVGNPARFLRKTAERLSK